MSHFGNDIASFHLLQRLRELQGTRSAGQVFLPRGPQERAPSLLRRPEVTDTPREQLLPAAAGGVLRRPTTVTEGTVAEPQKGIGQTVADVVGSIFTGRDDPDLSPEANRAARGQALMRAGLSMLAASGNRGLESKGLGEILAIGALAGQETGQVERAKAVRQDLLDTLKGIDFSDDASVEKARQALFPLAAAGDAGAFSALQVLERQVAAEEDRRFRADQLNEKQEFEARQAELDRLFKLGLLERKEGETEVTKVDTGRFIKMIDQKTGEVLWAISKDPEPVSMDHQALGRSIKNDLSLLGQRDRPPSIFAYAAYTNGVTRPIVGEEDQTWLAAAQRVSANIVRLLSGAQASEKEVARVFTNFLPAPGDRPGTFAVKMEQINFLAEGLTNLQGGDGTGVPLLLDRASQVGGTIVAPPPAPTPTPATEDGGSLEDFF